MDLLSQGYNASQIVEVDAIWQRRGAGIEAGRRERPDMLISAATTNVRLNNRSILLETRCGSSVARALTRTWTGTPAAGDSAVAGSVVQAGRGASSPMRIRASLMVNVGPPGPGQRFQSYRRRYRC
jgi:hypothetical protein